jgi:hypothetical protein
MTVPVRIYADFNSVYGEGGSICWCLRYGRSLRLLDEFAEELRLRDGMTVILYYEDESEEFEVSGALIEQPVGTVPRWHARVDWKTRKQIRG